MDDFIKIEVKDLSRIKAYEVKVKNLDNEAKPSKMFFHKAVMNEVKGEMVMYSGSGMSKRDGG